MNYEDYCDDFVWNNTKGCYEPVRYDDPDDRDPFFDGWEPTYSIIEPLDDAEQYELNAIMQDDYDDLF